MTHREASGSRMLRYAMGQHSTDENLFADTKLDEHSIHNLNGQACNSTRGGPLTHAPEGKKHPPFDTDHLQYDALRLPQPDVGSEFDQAKQSQAAFSTANPRT